MHVRATDPDAPLLLRLPIAQVDQILAAAEAFVRDIRGAKVNLSIGMYYDESGRVPLLGSVRAAEQRIMSAANPWVYGAMEGDARLRALVPGLLFGETASERERVIQTIGGTGALTIGAELLKAALDAPVVALTAPTWPNHRAIFERLGYAIRDMRYFDPADGGLDFDGLMADLAALPEGSVVVLHGCCHNPTGVDPDAEQWERIVELLARRRHVPFLDMAYLGFANGTFTDARPARLCRAAGLTTLMALSFSKSFSLYGERVGALVISATEAGAASRAFAYARSLARTSYSMPPSHGAMIAATILEDPLLNTQWQDELAGMRERIARMRSRLAARIADHATARDFSRLARQSGLFSYSGLRPDEVDRLRDEHAIHAVHDGRLCIAALNDGNVDRVGDAIAAVARMQA